jgi:hypothetical protein
MYGMRDLRVLWGLGAIMLVFCGIGVMAAATAIGLPLYMAAAMLGASEQAMIKLFLYSAILWAPIGFGVGIATSSTLVRGIRRGSGSKPEA